MEGAASGATRSLQGEPWRRERPLEPGLQALFKTAVCPGICSALHPGHLLLGVQAPNEVSKGTAPGTRPRPKSQKNDFRGGSAQEPPEASKESPGAGSGLWSHQKPPRRALVEGAASGAWPPKPFRASCLSRNMFGAPPWPSPFGGTSSERGFEGDRPENFRGPRPRPKSQKNDFRGGSAQEPPEASKESPGGGRGPLEPPEASKEGPVGGRGFWSLASKAFPRQLGSPRYASAGRPAISF